MMVHLHLLFSQKLYIFLAFSFKNEALVCRISTVCLMLLKTLSRQKSLRAAYLYIFSTAKPNILIAVCVAVIGLRFSLLFFFSVMEVTYCLEILVVVTHQGYGFSLVDWIKFHFKLLSLAYAVLRDNCSLPPLIVKVLFFQICRAIYLKFTQCWATVFHAAIFLRNSCCITYFLCYRLSCNCGFSLFRLSCNRGFCTRIHMCRQLITSVIRSR